MPEVRDADAVDVVVGLAFALREAGVPTVTERVHTAVAALASLDPTRRADVYWACRLALCGSRDGVDRFDDVFAGWFGERAATVIRPPQPPPSVVRFAVGADSGAGGPHSDGASAPVASSASKVEQLRTRDVTTLSPADREELRRLLAALRPSGEQRLSRRRRPGPRGAVDGARTLRAWLEAGGEPARLRHHAPVRRPRRVVLLVDVSGSMASYADALLRFAHAASRRGSAPAEVFALGTRLTRVSREMSLRNVDEALGAVSETVLDAGGGTRLGELLKQFLDQWGQRGTARGAVVVVMSDGLERGDAALLGEQMARLHRLAHRVVWCNPHKGVPGYAPLVVGMAAALPHVDDFVEGHSLGALEHLAAVVRGA